MSLVDFRYSPLSGSLSGESFEQQTAAAFNELGQEMSDFEEGLDSAQQVALNASKQADNALLNSEEALSAAQKADGGAAEALTLAAESQILSAEAQVRAEGAYDLAAQADSRSQEAFSLAQRAGQAAEAAEDKAQSAVQQAQSAQQSAEAAMALMAEAGNEAYLLTEEAIDADDYLAPARLYLVNELSLNFPLTGPLYFLVSADSSGLSVSQQVWKQSSPDTIYYRSGLSDGQGGFTWGQWLRPAGESSSSDLPEVLPISQGGTGNQIGQAASATKLATARTVQTNLASTAAASFDGSANIAPGVTGVLAIANGGTGNQSAQAASAAKLATARTVQTNLASTAAASFDGSANVSPGVTGVLAIANGGTGTSSVDTLRSKIGAAALPTTSETVGQCVFTLSIQTQSMGGDLLVLPSGGTWFYYFTVNRKTSGSATAADVNIGGVAAGGSSVLQAYSITVKNGFAWRVA